MSTVHSHSFVFPHKNRGKRVHRSVVSCGFTTVTTPSSSLSSSLSLSFCLAPAKINTRVSFTSNCLLIRLTFQLAAKKGWWVQPTTQLYINTWKHEHIELRVLKFPKWRKNVLFKFIIDIRNLMNAELLVFSLHFHCIAM